MAKKPTEETETPKTKLQTPKKSQVPSSKLRLALRVGTWSLELLWCLELGTWSFFGIWCLVFGALIGGRTSSLPNPGQGEWCLDRLWMVCGREVREGTTQYQTPSSREIPDSKHQT